MNQRVFKKGFLLNVLCGGVEGAKVIENQIADASRWSITHDLVFEYEGRFWATHYTCVATEHQEETPWEGKDKVTCYEVFPVEKTVIVYE